jgi:hypothetical protein
MTDPGQSPTNDATAPPAPLQNQRSAKNSADSAPPTRRDWVARAFTLVEDAVYLALGLLLTGCALTLLVTSAIDLVHSVGDGSVNIIRLLDRILLVLLIVELL